MEEHGNKAFFFFLLDDGPRLGATLEALAPIRELFPLFQGVF
jgi:hypothetical protein